MALEIDIHDGWKAPTNGKSTSPRALPMPAEPRDPAFAAALATLTTRQYDTLRARCEGMTNREIAERFFVSHMTVKNTLTETFRKLGIAPGVRGNGRSSARACYLLGAYDADVDISR